MSIKIFNNIQNFPGSFVYELSSENLFETIKRELIKNEVKKSSLLSRLFNFYFSKNNENDLLLYKYPILMSRDENEDSYFNCFQWKILKKEVVELSSSKEIGISGRVASFIQDILSVSLNEGEYSCIESDY